MAKVKSKIKKQTKKTKQNLGELQAPQPLKVSEREPTLSLQQEMFAQYFVSETEFYGNGVQSYCKAYDVQITPFNYDMIKSRCARLLMTPLVMKRISDLLHEDGFNDGHADKHLLFLMTQNMDMRSKLGAIREYNKLKSRVESKLQLDAPITSITVITAKKREEISAPVVIHDQDESDD